MPHSPSQLAVIGAGLSGLSCAVKMQEAGWGVRVFEKSRGVGGRMATRRAEAGLRFDHGAQYFTVRDARFERYVQQCLADETVAAWEGRIVDLTDGTVTPKQQGTSRFVGIPDMNAICKSMATGIDVQLQTRLVPPIREQGRWRLHDDQGGTLGAFDCVVSSAPAPQTAELLKSAPALARQAEATTMAGCWAAMIAVPEPLRLPCEGAFVHDSPLSWIARNDSKPGRLGGETPVRDGSRECWVLHAASDWSMQHLEAPAERVLPTLVEAFWKATGTRRQTVSHATAHLWRYAIAAEPLSARCLFDPRLQIGACGDWCCGARVEGAFLSGLALAEHLLAGESPV